MASDKLVINQVVHEPVRTSIANPASDQKKKGNITASFMYMSAEWRWQAQRPRCVYTPEYTDYDLDLEVGASRYRLCPSYSNTRNWIHAEETDAVQKGVPEKIVSDIR